VPAHAGSSRRRVVLTVAVSATGALLVAGVVGLLLHTATPAGNAVVESASTLGFATTPAPPQARPTAGIVHLSATINGHAQSASGVVLDSRGTIITTAAAVGGATSIVALLADGTEATAVLLGVDDDSGAAVLTIQASPLAAATGRAVTLTSGTEVHVTDPQRVDVVVDALGAHADMDATHRLSHLVRLDEKGDVPVTEGAALLDADENVVGLCTHDDDGDLYAVPIEIPRAAAQSLAVHGRIVVPWLGVAGIDKTTTDGGAVVKSVAPTSPAHAAGLAPGDVIVALEGERIASMAALALTLRQYDAGAMVDVTYVRGGVVNVASVLLAAEPDS
jgi:serine protease DegS